jgi:hypothetical protein
MLQYGLASRLSVSIVGADRPPSVVVDSGSGGLGVDVTRRGVSIYECDWQRMVQLSAREALALLTLLREHESLLVEMAAEDDTSVLEAARALAERSWRVPLTQAEG